MSNDLLIKVDHVSKKFCKDLKRSLWYGMKDVFFSFGGGKDHHQRLRKDEFWALDDISFELRRGECLGLIGHNGAGKSTLLKMLNGLLAPDMGSITMKGRVGALIELSAGINPLLTGRENIYNNGAVLGFSKKEIDEKFDSILEFAEMEEFIDSPVQNYSSGMKLKLGFAIAVQSEPDILLIDEVLAVGDANFIVKSYNKINELIKRCSVVFVSHNLPQVAKICSSVIYLKKGRVVQYSRNINEVISNYLSTQKDSEEFKIQGGENVISFDVECNNHIIDNRFYSLGWNENLNLKFDFTLKEAIHTIYSLVVKLFDSELRPSGVFQSKRFDQNGKEISLQVSMNNINLSPGTYSLTTWLLSHQSYDTPHELIEIGLESVLKVKIHGETTSNFAFARFMGDIDIMSNLEPKV